MTGADGAPGIAGAIVAAATSLLLSLLGAAFGGGSVGDLQAAARGEANAAGTGVAIWAIIDLFLSMLFGGYVASRLSGTHSHLDGELHGITMWALATLLGALGALRFAGAVAGAIEGTGFNIGPAIIGSRARAIRPSRRKPIRSGWSTASRRRSAGAATPQQ